MDVAVEPDEALIDSLLEGAIDTHCHSGPSVMPRDLDHLEAMREASAAGMHAVVMKDHYYSIVPVAHLLNKHFSDLNVKVMAGVALNNSVGGLNPYAVEHSLKLGGKLVWLPTFSARNHVAHMKQNQAAYAAFPKARVALPVKPITVFDAAGVLVEEMDTILELIAAADAVLAGGHLHISEIWPVFRRAKELGVTRFLVNHPTFVVEATDADIAGLATFGAYIEHSICMFDPQIKEPKGFPPDLLKHLIEVAGVGSTILGSDLGQVNMPHPVEGFRRVIRTCLGLGFSPQDIRMMIATNPARLLGLQ